VKSRVAIFASGAGTNTENICHFFTDTPDISVVLILSNKKSALVLEKVKKLRIDVCVFTKNQLTDYVFIQEILDNYGVDFIVLAGFLLKIPKKMVENYPNKIINIHPALLPKYGGKGMYGENVHKAVLENKESESGITIHFVNNKYDEGKIVFMARCTVEKVDTPESLANKIHRLEKEYFPKIIASIIRKK
jgi:phosphoribosylglycinamide formyltransferase-1